MKDKKMPIGFYLKQVDKLLTERINFLQAEFGLTRTSWQILNTINEQEAVRKEELVKLMGQLTDKCTIDDVLKKFGNEKIIKLENNDLLIMTGKGKTLFNECSKKQNEFRKQSMEGVSEQEYQTTILTLEKILKNLE